jgi:CRP-like cAMP-binding protein
VSGNPVETYQEGGVICFQGAPADCLYILRGGGVGVVVNLEETTPDLAALCRDGIRVAEIRDAGAIVGEAGLFLERRTASLRALESPTRLEVIPLLQSDAEKLILHHPQTGLTLCRSLAARLRRTSRRIREVSEVTSQVETLCNGYSMTYRALLQEAEKAAARLDAAALQERREHWLCRRAREQERHRQSTHTVFDLARARKRAGTIRLEPGMALCREGDVGRALYLVQEGALEVRIAGRRVATVEAEELVGEVAVLLKEQPLRTASIKALTEARLTSISALDFTAIARERPSILVALARTLSRRLETTNRLVCDMDRGVEQELDRLAATPDSCEAAFRALRDLLGTDEALTEAAERAEAKAAETAARRQELAAIAAAVRGVQA